MIHQEQALLIVVEKEPFMRKYIVSCINQMQLFRLIEASSMADALKIIEEKKPDVILYDLMLQDKSTGSLIIQARKLDTDYYPYAVALSATHEDKQIQGAYDGGANYFLEKGFSRFALMGVLNNILTQIEYRKSIKEQERFFRSLFELASSPMLLVRLKDMTIVRANNAANNLYMGPDENISGKKLETLSSNPAEIRNILREKITHVSNILQKKSDGKLFHAMIACAYFEDAEDSMALITVNDISELLRQQEEKIALLQLQRMSNTETTYNEVMAFLTGEENERRRISAELHDHIGQLMVALKLQMENCIDKINDNALQKSLYNIRNNLIVVADAIHSVSEEVADNFIPENDLTKALKKLINKISKSQKLTIHSNWWENPPALSVFVQTNLYRIAEEALNNILKHTPTSTVSLKLEFTNQHVHLNINNFYELSQNEFNQKGMGLRLMQQRAALIGGKLHFKKTDKSFHVSLSLPLDHLE